MLTLERTYKNYECVRPLQPAYEARRAELAARSAYPYNDMFKGHLGVEFATGRDEDYAIYMLQTLHDLDEIDRKLAAFLAEGGEVIEHIDAPTRFARVVRYGWYVGGTGWAEFTDVRLAARNGKGRPYVAIPRGRRTHGFDVSTGTILAIK